jgi:FMN phosphatase YigB (HAD superfamily)
MARRKADVEGIIFDFDNTLMDFALMKIRSIYVAVKEMRRHGMPLGILDSFNKIFSIYNLPGKGWEHPQIFQEFLKQLDFKRAAGSPDYFEIWLMAGINAYREEKAKLTIPYDGTRIVLNQLRASRFELGILTDAPKRRVYERLLTTELMYRMFKPEKPGREFLFKTIVTPDDAPVFNVDGSLLLDANGFQMLHHKPEPEFFKIAIENMGIKPENLLFVGDSYEKDMTGAKAAGMKTALAMWGLTSSLNDEEFMDFLKQIPASFSSVQSRTLALIEAEKIPDADYSLEQIIHLPSIVRLKE